VRPFWFESVVLIGFPATHHSSDARFRVVFVATHQFVQRIIGTRLSKVAIKKRTPNAFDLQGRRIIDTYDDIQQHQQEIKVLLQRSSTISSVLYMYEYFMSGKDLSIVTELLGQDLDDWRQRATSF
jgi:hypothetical protein